MVVVMLVNGQWVDKWDPVQAKDDQGRFVRQTSSFRHWITPDGSPGPTGNGGYQAEAGRYHLYVALICPWASRTLIVRKLKKLESWISLSVVEPFLTEQGWRFGDFQGATHDHLHQKQYLHEVYTMAASDFTGRATVPVLWDKKNQTMVNNESADIIRMLNQAFDHVIDNKINLYPDALSDEIEQWNQDIYQNLNNGVYRAGFATTQFAYEEAYHHVFDTLDKIESRLHDGRPFIHGASMTETDIRLFVTLIRFDAAYYGLFKCNRNLIVQMPKLSEYLKRLYAIPEIQETVNLTHIKQGYYSMQSLNPNGIVPIGPDLVV